MADPRLNPCQRCGRMCRFRWPVRRVWHCRRCARAAGVRPAYPGRRGRGRRGVRS